MHINLGKIGSPSTRISDMVYDKVAEAIIDGDFAPGERIRDTEIAEDMGVSRMPVREALLRLERDGLIEMSASRYTRVTEIDAETVRQTIDFVSLQAALIARVALERMEPGLRQRAHSLIDDYARAAREKDVEQLLHAAFTAIDFVCEHSGNPLLSKTIEEARFSLVRHFRETTPWTLDAARLERELPRIRRAIDEGDGRMLQEAILSLAVMLPPTNSTSDQPNPTG